MKRKKKQSTLEPIIHIMIAHIKYWILLMYAQPSVMGGDTEGSNFSMHLMVHVFV